MNYRTKLACSNASFPLLSLDKAIKVIQLLDFAGVDIGLFEGRGNINPSQEFINPISSGKRLGKLIKESNLELADIFYQGSLDFESTAINNPDSQVRQKSHNNFKKLLDYVYSAEGKHLTILPGVHWTNETISASLNRSMDELFWYISAAKEADITISFEPHLGSHLSTPEIVNKFCESLPQATLTLDFGHFIYQGYTSDEILPLLEYASHFHGRCAARQKLQASLSENEIDHTKVISKMRSLSYRGWVGIEYVWIDWEQCNKVDIISETIQLKNIFDVS
jgi:sugar phosphate isomerase/epimerase